ncbi:hypothetical protein ORJ04_18260 [Rheinheimera baltica]|uniref:Uncharacterized protein n=1 Tax=Rheinheimera baltica TaxID=67576 RepID=A0ABT9I3F1_9GAMM|nr:hypothetical protein [Rheinheimera baltica]MDP5137899.1 hypothetical protein [Rheinheimera baltica]MDP5150975.1 hypothetical protein [Rheinheimera baltica]
MLCTYPDTEISLPYEEEINGFTIYIGDNPDRWRSGYSWAVCKDRVVLDEGLTFTLSDAIHSAKIAIAVL